MLFGYVPYNTGTGDRIELCLLASKPDSFSRPIRIDALQPTEAAICLLSPTEAVTVGIDQAEKAMIITALPGGVIFLTPDTSERPGVGVMKVKVEFVGDKNFKVSYARKLEDAWVKWEPLVAAR